MGENLIVDHLKVTYGEKLAVDDVSFSLSDGKIYVIVGESGSGKTTLLRTIGGLLKNEGKIVSGEIKLKEQNLAHLSEKEWGSIHGSRIGYIFQNPEQSLSPLSKIEKQFLECGKVKTEFGQQKMSVLSSDRRKKEILTEAEALLGKLRFENPKRILKSYPFELSGGMCQRVAIALAIMNHPDLLLADEPTSALDVAAQNMVIETLLALREETGLSILLVTHNMDVACRLADEIGVMYQGRIIEAGSPEEILHHPKEAYTKKLIDAIPKMQEAGTNKGEGALLRAEHLKKIFHGNAKDSYAVQNVSFEIMPGECLGLIGESGSGKSTIARILTGMLPATEGSAYFEGKLIVGKKVPKDARKDMQMIFQNPKTSLNPKMTIGQNLEEALRYYEKLPKTERKERCEKILERVHLPREYSFKYPDQLSGGECQRVCIARALLRHPKLLICDEATSALDVSVQKEIVELLKQVQKEEHMALLFISHDVALVSNFCDRVIRLSNGEITEPDAGTLLFPLKEYN